MFQRSRALRRRAARSGQSRAFWLFLTLLAAVQARAQQGAAGAGGAASEAQAGAADDELPSLTPLGKGFPEPAAAAPPSEPPAPEPPPPSAQPAAAAPAAAAPGAAAMTPAVAATDAGAAPASTLTATDGPAGVPVAQADVAGERRAAVVDFEAGRGFELHTLDGDFALAIGAGLQVLYTAVLPDVGENRQYLELRRARLRFSGNLFGVHNRYFLQLALSPRDLGRRPVEVSGAAPGTDANGDPTTPTTADDVLTRSPLLDAWLQLGHLRDLNFQIGQFRIPFSRQRVMPFPSMHYADRALATQQLGLDRDIGFMLMSRDFLGLECLRYYAGLFIGEGRDSSSQTLGAGDRGMSYVVRAEVTPFGRFDDDYADVDFQRRAKPSLSLGAAYALLQGDATSPIAEDDLGMVYDAPGQQPIVDYNAHNVTLDAMFKLRGLSLQGAFYFKQVAPIPNARDGVGMLLDAGYLLPPIPLEVLGAFSMTRATSSDSSLAEQNELGGGLAYYIFDQFLKVQLDVFHLWAKDAFSAGDERVRLQMYAGF